MQTTLNAAVESYLRAKALSRGTRNEYFSTLRKWEQWGAGGPIEELRRKDIRAFLDWVYERAVALLPSTNRSSGVTYRGVGNRQTVMSRSSHVGAGCSIAE